MLKYTEVLVMNQCDPVQYNQSAFLSCPPGQVLLPFVTFYGDPGGGRNVTFRGGWEKPLLRATGEEITYEE